jgi:hypothetical protein
MPGIPPPPIPWRTKPNLNQQRTQSSSLRPSQQSTNGLVVIYIHPDCLPDIEAAFRYLGLPPLLNPRDDHYLATAMPASHEENPNPSHPVPPQFQPRNNPQPVIAHGSNTDDLDYSDLTRSFSQLSTSELPGSCSQLLPASFPAQHGLQPDTSPRKNRKKYYVVTIGKRTGIFWDEW